MRPPRDLLLLLPKGPLRFNSWESVALVELSVTPTKGEEDVGRTCRKS